MWAMCGGDGCSPSETDDRGLIGLRPNDPHHSQVARVTILRFQIEDRRLHLPAAGRD
jgi:hypothetical protein